MDGILLVNKPVGITSREAVDIISEKMNEKKTGHTGSLDPFASGLLMVTLGKATKAGQFVESLDKTYVATLKLGTKTDSGDLTGKVIEKSEVYPLFESYVQEALETFLGDGLQMPPMLSALKVAGVPLYKYARKGQVIERQQRPIHVFNIDLIELKEGEFTFSVRVSKGTYIRTLGEDIAVKLGMVGHLTALTRTQIGSFKLENATAPELVEPTKLISVYDALIDMEHVIVKDDYIRDVKDGKNQFFETDEPIVLVISRLKEVLAVYERMADGRYHSVRGLF
jgi:tRNA pseudouridine55 synthase